MSVTALEFAHSYFFRTGLGERAGTTVAVPRLSDPAKIACNVAVADASASSFGASIVPTTERGISLAPSRPARASAKTSLLS